MEQREQFERNITIIGEEGQVKLAATKVLVFGVGGVGGFVCEALARAGVGEIHIVDGDVVSESNINRQIIAMHSTIGKEKVVIMAERMKDINPALKVKATQEFFAPDNHLDIDFDYYDYIVDAIDQVTAKLEIITCAKDAGVPVISSMGTGNKLDPGRFQIADISKTSVCPLAKAMRKELRERGIKNVDVLFSTEEPIIKSRTPGSISFVSSVAGLMIAGYVVKKVLNL